VGEDDALGRDDFPEFAFHRIDVAVRTAHMDADRTADTHVNLANRISKPFGSPPLRELIGVGPSLEHEHARRMEHGSDGDLAFGRFRFSRDGHIFLPERHPWPAKARCSAATSNFFMAISALMALSRLP